MTGHETRGKTTRNRLRRVDHFLMMYDRGLIRKKKGVYKQAFFVDLGYGAMPYTTMESASRLRMVNPSLPILGVEITKERVDAAQPFADAQTHFRLGDFSLPLEPGETVKIIRAFNVLRQYEEDEVVDAHRVLSSYLLPGGMLIEGTSDPYGRVWVANVIRKDADARVYQECLVFSTNFADDFDPLCFQPVLPKNFIHRMIPGETIFSFMEDWKRAARATIAYRNFGVRRWFVESCHRLGEYGYKLAYRRKFLRTGYLIWYMDGVTRG